MFDRQTDLNHAGTNEHESYRELCALASSGALSDSEWSKLSNHLKDCVECRAELAKYQEIATFGMSLVSPTDASLDAENEWSPESAVAKLMNRLREQSDDSREALRKSQIGKVQHWPFVPFNSSSFLPYVAAVVVFAAVAGSLYFAGVRAGERRTSSDPQQLVQPDSSLEVLVRERAQLKNELQSLSEKMEATSQQLQDARAALDVADAQKRASDERINQLERQTLTQQADNAALHAQYRDIQSERLAADAKLQQSAANLAAVQHNFDLLRDQHAADVAQIANLEAQMANVSHQPQPAAYVEAQQLSTAEPEISDLMGARDLFIADVYDIDNAGLRQKPFGRIFYTKGRRLLFYAFDLDRAQGVKNASTFQVWGRRGYGDTHPLNMGVMYLDSKATQRWALKFDDAKALSQVDAVFVTIEPRGGSDTPKGRQLLYASLKTPANHP